MASTPTSMAYSNAASVFSGRIARAGGHVLPERAAEDLPRAVEAIRAEGLSVPMITTGLVKAADPAARPTLSTAARLGIGLFKPGYWQYRATDSVEERVAEVRK